MENGADHYEDYPAGISPELAEVVSGMRRLVAAHVHDPYQTFNFDNGAVLRATTDYASHEDIERTTDQKPNYLSFEIETDLEDLVDTYSIEGRIVDRVLDTDRSAFNLEVDFNLNGEYLGHEINILGPPLYAPGSEAEREEATRLFNWVSEVMCSDRFVEVPAEERIQRYP